VTPSIVNKTTTGWIDKNEIWKDEIHITGSIRLEKDVTLTIEPGTTVYIAPNSNDQQSPANRPLSGNYLILGEQMNMTWD
jgi:hypothetical protein